MENDQNINDIFQVAGGNKALQVEVDPKQVANIGLVIFLAMFLAMLLALILVERFK